MVLSFDSFYLFSLLLLFWFDVSVECVGLYSLKLVWSDIICVVIEYKGPRDFILPPFPLFVDVNSLKSTFFAYQYPFNDKNFQATSSFSLSLSLLVHPTQTHKHRLLGGLFSDSS